MMKLVQDVPSEMFCSQGLLPAEFDFIQQQQHNNNWINYDVYNIFYVVLKHTYSLLNLQMSY